MSKTTKVLFKVLDVIMIFMMTFGAPLSALAAPLAQEEIPPTITSDLSDYPPGALVTLTGANWQGDTTVHIVVDDTLNQSWQHIADVTVASDGTIADTFFLPVYFVSDYNVTATGNDTQRVATTAFTDANDTNVGTY